MSTSPQGLKEQLVLLSCCLETGVVDLTCMSLLRFFLGSKGTQFWGSVCQLGDSCCQVRLLWLVSIPCRYRPSQACSIIGGGGGRYPLPSTNHQELKRPRIDHQEFTTSKYQAPGIQSVPCLAPITRNTKGQNQTPRIQSNEYCCTWNYLWGRTLIV